MDHIERIQEGVSSSTFTERPMDHFLGVDYSIGMHDRQRVSIYSSDLQRPNFAFLSQTGAKQVLANWLPCRSVHLHSKVTGLDKILLDVPTIFSKL